MNNSLINKKVYLIQPTYRKMDGSLVKSWSLFNHSLNLPILSGAIPDDWEKEFCMEYFEDVNFETRACVIIITGTGYDIMHAREISERFKKKGKIVIFGAHADDFSDKILLDVCDSVFYGIPSPKGMTSLLNDALCKKLLQRYNFGLNINFPFDYSVLNGKKMPFIQVQASAGCKNRCNYCCALPQSFSGKYRLRKVGFILKDLKAVNKMANYVSFIDPNIYNNRMFLQKLCRKMIDEKIRLVWGAQSTVDIGDDPETLKLLERSGCRILFIGLESVEQKNLCFLEKPYKAGDYLRQVTKIKEAGIHVAGYFMLGLDFDIKESSEAIYRFVRESGINLPVINVLMPVPGTKLFNILKSEDRLLMENFNGFLKNKPLYSVPCQTPFYVPKGMSADDLTRSFLYLVKRLYNYREIIKRSLVLKPGEAAKILVMNLELRKKYLVMNRNGVLLK